MTTAKEALECAETILKGPGTPGWTKKMWEYVGEWNTLTRYLEEQYRKEKVA